jgi:hypothetical protein
VKKIEGGWMEFDVAVASCAVAWSWDSQEGIDVPDNHNAPDSWVECTVGWNA